MSHDLRFRKAAVLTVALGILGATLPLGPTRLGAVSVPAPGQSAATSGVKDAELPPHVPGQVLVSFEPGVTSQRRAEVRRLIVAQAVAAISSRMKDTEIVSLGSGMSVLRAVQALRNLAGVRYAEPNYIVRSAQVSNDPDFTSGALWGMSGVATSPVNSFGSRASDAWANGYVGSSDVVVGVIDEGIDVTHPDLANNIWTNPGEVAGNGIDDDSNGYIDDVNGFDFVNNDGTVLDSAADDHGTHVAGTIGAQGGNGIGVAGVNWNVKMISAKFLQGGSGSTADAVRAIDYITGLKQKYGLNIVATSNSWGGGGFSQALLDAINRGGDAGILFIAAAGNSSSDNDALANYPSNYECTNGGTRGFDCVVAVASITSIGDISSFSSFGRTTVDIGAPGSAVKSTTPAGSYAVFSGTSMATPHVSGAAALCRAANPTMSASQTREALVQSVRTTDSLAGKVLGSGRLDVDALMKQCVASTSPVSGLPTSLSGTAIGLTTIRLDWTDGASAETGYVIQQAADNGGSCGNFTTIGHLGADNTRFYVQNLQSSTSYCFRVGANGQGGTLWSDGIAVATQSLPAPYVCSSSAYSWITPPADATTHVLSDDSAAAVQMPFAFDLYGTAVSSALVSSNGFLRFDGGVATDYIPAAIPSLSEPNFMAAPWWMDFNPTRGGQIRSHLTGTAPQRSLVVSWLDLMPWSTSATNGASFQVILDEATRSITYQYRDTAVGTTTMDRGRTGAVGVEGAEGVYGTQVLFNSAGLADATAIRCTRSQVPVITSTSLSSGVVNSAYSQAIGVSGGTGTKTLSLESGSLPPGLVIDGLSISGSPTTAGSWSFTLRVTDQNAASSTSALQIVIVDPLVVSTSTLNAATIGTAYNQSLVATGGLVPNTWSVASGALPAGLALSSSGVITGTPTAAAKNATFTARVTDSAGRTATVSLSIRVNVAITTASVVGATQGVAYSQTLASVGGLSSTPHTWSVTAGSPPTGLAMSSTGILSGTPAVTATTATFTVSVTDGTSEGIATRSYTLTVSPPLAITTSSLPNATIGTAYSQTLSASGVSGSATWSVVSGSLPAGLVLSPSTGVISGTATSGAVSSNFTVRVADTSGRTSDRALSITVLAAAGPGAFNKSSPANSATRVSRTPTLQWANSTGAVRYEYCVDRTNNNACDGAWVSAGTAVSVTLSRLPTRTIHYWQVRAVGSSAATTFANTGTWWRFTTQ